MWHRLVVLAALTITPACDKAPTPPTMPSPPDSPTVVSIQVTAPVSAVHSVGASIGFTAAALNSAGAPVPNQTFTWASSDPSVAQVTSLGTVTAVSEGTADIRASAAGVTGSTGFTISTRVVEGIPSYLATPAAGYLWEVPVVILRYFPTADGLNVDPDKAGWVSDLETLRQRVEIFENRIKFMLEEGSRFRGYADPGAPPAIGYRIVHIETVYDAFERGKEVPWNLGHYFPDYNLIMERANAENWVNNHGVKEFWVWGYHTDEFEQPESNMSSPLTGDISNSSRFADDLPVYDQSYTVYGYNFTRTQSEAVHNHGHQLEALLAHANGLQDGNTDLFWQQFVGTVGRAGWTHSPPNTTVHYDYNNTAAVQSDIEDWTPSGNGASKSVSRDTWRNLSYSWPMEEAGSAEIASPLGDLERTESQWYIYWMQNMPGRGNGIPHAAGFMSNWWAFTGDWDAAMGGSLGLHNPSPAAMAPGPRLKFPDTQVDRDRWPVHGPSSD